MPWRYCGALNSTITSKMYFYRFLWESLLKKSACVNKKSAGDQKPQARQGYSGGIFIGGVSPQDVAAGIRYPEAGMAAVNR
jgi:hypothetical protein